jgi:hypothetical protein
MLFADIPQRLLKIWGYAMFALLPMFAGLLRLVYRNRGMVYGEHLVFALHLHTFWLLTVAVIVLLPERSGFGVLALGLMIAIPVYALLAMRRVYRGRWWPRLLRAALLSLLYVGFMACVFVVVMLIALLA